MSRRPSHEEGRRSCRRAYRARRRRRAPPRRAARWSGPRTAWPRAAPTRSAWSNSGELSGGASVATPLWVSLHAELRVPADGHHVDDAGNLISCTYVDFRDQGERFPITALQKASSKRHAIPGCGTIRTSKPSCFLGQGEGVAGNGEDGRNADAGDPDDPGAAPAERPAAPGDEVHRGHNGWFYCASIEPERRRSLLLGGKRRRAATTPLRNAMVGAQPGRRTARLATGQIAGLAVISKALITREVTGGRTRRVAGFLRSPACDMPEGARAEGPSCSATATSAVSVRSTSRPVHAPERYRQAAAVSFRWSNSYNELRIGVGRASKLLVHPSVRWPITVDRPAACMLVQAVRSLCGLPSAKEPGLV